MSTNPILNGELPSPPPPPPIRSFFDDILRQAQEGDDRVKCALMEKTFEHFQEKMALPSSVRSSNKNGQSHRLNHDKDPPVEDEFLSFDGFTRLLTNLFIDRKANESFYIPRQWIVDLFKKFDKNGDNRIDRKEFTWMWVKWIYPILRPKSALVVVDVQNDFISGSLAISACPAGHRGEEVIPVINRIIRDIPFDAIVFSYDWHPLDHISFHDNWKKRKIIARNGLPVDENEELDIALFEEVTFKGPPQTDQKLWPKHCVQGSWGAQLHKDLTQPEQVMERTSESNPKRYPKVIKVYKGTNPLVDSYSAFWDNNKLSETGLGKELKDLGITHTFVCGIAYDFCVGFTGEHANEYSFCTTLINDATRGVDMKSISDMRNRLLNKSVVIIDSDRVDDMSRAKERRPEHAFHRASFIQ